MSTGTSRRILFALILLSAACVFADPALRPLNSPKADEVSICRHAATAVPVQGAAACGAGPFGGRICVPTVDHYTSDCPATDQVTLSQLLTELEARQQQQVDVLKKDLKTLSDANDALTKRVDALEAKLSGGN